MLPWLNFPGMLSTLFLPPLALAPPHLPLFQTSVSLTANHQHPFRATLQPLHLHHCPGTCLSTSLPWDPHLLQSCSHSPWWRSRKTTEAEYLRPPEKSSPWTFSSGENSTEINQALKLFKYFFLSGLKINKPNLYPNKRVEHYDMWSENTIWFKLVWVSVSNVYVSDFTSWWQKLITAVSLAWNQWCLWLIFTRQPWIPKIPFSRCEWLVAG